MSRLTLSRPACRNILLSGLVLLAAVVLMLILILGTVMYVVEGPGNGYTSIPVAMYWAVVTMTTNPVNAQNRAFFADLHEAFDRLRAGADAAGLLDLRPRVRDVAAAVLAGIVTTMTASAQNDCSLMRTRRPMRRS